MKEARIAREAFDFLATASANTYPNEFLGLLRANEEGLITEVLVFPLTVNARNYSFLNTTMIPWTVHYSGSVHSHPSSCNCPSQADLVFFSRFGNTHIIIAYPFNESSAKAYNSGGEELRLKIV